jgi:arylsulfatase A-like enzyme
VRKGTLQTINFTLTPGPSPIPFVMRWPGHIEPGRDDILFNSVDIMPTILGLMGIEVPQLVEGGDYSGIFRGENMERPDSALLQLGSWRAVRTPTHTFAVNHGTRKGPEGANLFNNAEDPYQMHPIAWDDGDREEMNDMRESMAEWLERTNDPFVYRLPEPRRG